MLQRVTRFIGSPNRWVLPLLTGLVCTASVQNLAAISPPVIGKSFFPVLSIPVGGATGLTFTINNPNAADALTGVEFVDPLPAGLIVATPNGVTGSCGGGTITAAAGSSTISLTGATLAASATCTFKVNVVATVGSVLTNTTGNVMSANGGVGNTASASITVGASLRSYAVNLSVGPSAVNMSNSGANGAALPSGTSASITGAICVNVYAFTPDEQLVSCCSCPVTPNGLVSLSVNNDLASNTLTPAVPEALTITLVATNPVGGTCTNAAAALTSATLAPGMLAWGTTLHSTPPSGTYGITETPYVPGVLAAGELSRIGNLCNFILANTTASGTCRSCRLGAQ